MSLGTYVRNALVAFHDIKGDLKPDVVGAFIGSRSREGV